MNTQNLLDQYFETAFSAPDGIKRLRELILTLAMQGKLVPQDQTDQPARELLQEIEAEKQRLIKAGKIKKSKLLPPIQPEEIPYDLPESWEWVRLGQYAYVFSGNAFNSGDFVQKDGAKVIKITNAGVGSIIETNDYLPNDFCAKYSDYLVKEKDLILALTRPYISSGLKVSLCPNRYDGALLNQRVAAIRVLIFPEFIFCFLRSPHVLLLYQERFRGSGLQPNLKIGDVSELLIPIPPLAEQKRIVEKCDRLMAQCDKLEQLQKEKEQKRILIHTAAREKLLKASDQETFGQAWEFIRENFGELYTVKENVTSLSQAILQLAVMGKLVPQDPDDPPASELLKEIEAEKQRLIKEGKIKKQKPLPEITPEEIPYELPDSWEWVRIRNICHDWGQKQPDRQFTYIDVGCQKR